MATVWPDAAQAVFAALGLLPPTQLLPSNHHPILSHTTTNNNRGGDDDDDNQQQQLPTSPLFGSHLGGLTGTGDMSTLLTRFLQFGAFGSFIQFLGITEMIRWICNMLYDYLIGQFVLKVHFDGDEMPYL